MNRDEEMMVLYEERAARLFTRYCYLSSASNNPVHHVCREVKVEDDLNGAKWVNICGPCSADPASVKHCNNWAPLKKALYLSLIHI